MHDQEQELSELQQQLADIVLELRLISSREFGRHPGLEHAATRIENIGERDA